MIANQQFVSSGPRAWPCVTSEIIATSMAISFIVQWVHVSSSSASSTCLLNIYTEMFPGRACCHVYPRRYMSVDSRFHDGFLFRNILRVSLSFACYLVDCIILCKTYGYKNHFMDRTTTNGISGPKSYRYKKYINDRPIGETFQNLGNLSGRFGNNNPFENW